MTRTPVEVPDALFARLREKFNEAELVELTSAIAWENYRARFDHAFGIEAENFSGRGGVRAAGTDAVIRICAYHLRNQRSVSAFSDAPKIAEAESVSARDQLAGSTRWLAMSSSSAISPKAKSGGEGRHGENRRTREHPRPGSW